MKIDASCSDGGPTPLNAASKLEQTALERRLLNWLSPSEMETIARRLNVLLGEWALARPGKLFREAHVAARLTGAHGADRVRLLPENSFPTPDFEMLRGNEVLRFESAEVDDPNRRRGDEVRHGIECDIRRLTRKTVVDAMRRAAANKASKAYGVCHGLILHLNIMSFRDRARVGHG